MPGSGDHRSGPDRPPEESAEDLYENAPCGYVSSLPDGTIVRVNATFLGWTGYAGKDLLGTTRLQELLAPGGRIYWETHYAPLLRMQGRVGEIASEIVCADGRRLPVLLSSVLRNDEAGRPLLMRTMVFDATQRKEYERELLRARAAAEAADRAKSDFISMISHEIRTPLNAIVGVAHLLGMTELSEAQQKYVRTLRSSSDNLLALINDILDFSKIAAGKVKVEERAFDLRQLVHGLIVGMQVRTDQKGIALDLAFDPSVPETLAGDPVKIGQVLTNLLGNAVKFTARGSVALSVQVVRREAETVVLRFAVSDTGIGIPADRLPHIFEDFTQASYDISMKYGGSGLGLAICRKLVEMHGGQITVQSEVGRGSTFSFEITLRTAVSAALEAAAEAGSERGALEGLKALVVDDNEVNVFVLTGFLQNWGARCEVAVSGDQAVARVRENDYDVVLMDLRMPGLDGYQAVRQIRALAAPWAKDVPIVAVSASTRMGQGDAIEAAGFSDFIGKPVNPDILLAKLSAIVARRRLTPRPPP
jgi:PAS domain S-box-containing protein